MMNNPVGKGPKLVTQFIHGLKKGGAEALVRDYAVTLNRKGCKTEVLLRDHDEDSSNYRYLRENGVTVLSLINEKDYQSRRVLPKIIRQIKIIRGVNHYIRTKRPDIIHVHLGILKYLVFAPLRSTHVFYTIHNPIRHYFAHNSRKGQIEYMVAKRLLRRKKITFIALQEELAEESNTFFQIDDTKVLYNGIFLEKYRYSEKWKTRKREELGIPQDAFVVGHIGRFTGQKNQMYLLDVFYKLVIKREDAVLLCVGAGEDLPKFRKRVRQYGLENKVFVASNRDDVPELISTMDRFVFPSVFEGFGIALLEAQAEGIPCIVSDRINNRVCVSNHFYKISLSESAESWANAVLDAPESNVPICDIRNYDMDVIVDQLMRFYSEIYEARNTEIS